MSARHTARTVRKALDVLLDLPPAALAMLAARLIDRLDIATLDADLEDDNEDCCDAGDCGGRPLQPDGNAGDGVDAEPSLGWPERMVQGIAEDTFVPDLERDTADAEPDAEEIPRHFWPGLLGVEAWTGAGA